MDTKTRQDDGFLARLRAQLKVKLKAGARDERGAAAVFFAVGLLLLAPATLGLVDIYLTSTQRAQLQDALDTATLYAARSDKMTSAELQTIGDAALRANLKLPDGQRITSSSFTLDGIKVTGVAAIDAPGIGPQLWAKADLQAESEVLRNSNNVEVALVLDTTGSMSAQMSNLRAAAKDLVNLVVKDNQSPYYSKIALVPYSVGVNMGSYESKARDAAIGATNITAATQANPIQITSANHGLQTNERVLISGVKGMTELNGKEYVVTRVDANRFQLKGINGTQTGTYKAYTSGGTAQCLREGCLQQSFVNAAGAQTRFPKTACATERLGTHAYTDAGPASAKVGWHYTGGAGETGCKSGEIVPLTSTRKTLTDKIDKLASNGSTAGQIGLAWGWYMISPEWSSVWTGASTPAAYTKPQTLKVVVLMTDGAFNTHYCKGVNSKNGFGTTSQRINCNATNGNAFDQAEELCRNMKAKGVIVYTVGFNVGSAKDVKDLMQNCATSPENVYLPSGGTELKVAFRAIAQDINSLRISK